MQPLPTLDCAVADLHAHVGRVSISLCASSRELADLLLVRDSARQCIDWFWTRSGLDDATEGPRSAAIPGAGQRSAMLVISRRHGRGSSRGGHPGLDRV